MDKDGEQRLYFVLETKGTTHIGELKRRSSRKFIAAKNISRRWLMAWN
jgi:restriction endonuclease